MISTEERIIGDTIANIVPPPPAPYDFNYTDRYGLKAKSSIQNIFKDTPIKRCRIQPIKNDNERFSVVPFNPNPIIADTNIRKPVADDMQGLQGIAGGISFRPISSIKKKLAAPLLPKKNVAKASSFFIYPNPVQTSASITIEWKTMEKGDYEVTILNNAGQTLQRENIVIDSESNKATISLRSIVSGVYFVRLTNKKTGKAFTEKIIVQ